MTEHEGRTFHQPREQIAGREMRLIATDEVESWRRNVTADPERYALYRLCECTTCGGSGRESGPTPEGGFRSARCSVCRGEGRTRDLIATCGTPEALGVAIVTLAREGEWEGCPIGILDTLGEPGEKWLVRPWLPSARNISDAGRTLANARKDPRTKLGTESEARGLLPRRKK